MQSAPPTSMSIKGGVGRGLWGDSALEASLWRGGGCCCGNRVTPYAMRHTSHAPSRVALSRVSHPLTPGHTLSHTPHPVTCHMYTTPPHTCHTLHMSPHRVSYLTRSVTRVTSDTCHTRHIRHTPSRVTPSHPSHVSSHPSRVTPHHSTSHIMPCHTCHVSP